MRHRFHQTERSQTPHTKYQLVIFDFDATLPTRFPGRRVWSIGSPRYGFKRIDPADYAPCTATTHGA
ncbi:MAG: hypothetical protein NZ553_11600 [Caldilinea sp.]|nr:hypothetical protein [Caldilinea sp.]MDW8441110.1 hypothetical protein [Caldilineaceae bacterium]